MGSRAERALRVEGEVDTEGFERGREEEEEAPAGTVSDVATAAAAAAAAAVAFALSSDLSAVSLRTFMLADCSCSTA